MRRMSGKWRWTVSDHPDNELLSCLLTKPNHSIAIAFPRPPGWIGTRPADHDLVRAILSDAAEESWGPAPTG